ncbi:MAG: ADP-dependent NAD(P)H-hydrate dehydratase / NAD(P)H-hydrate epimerase [Clostridiales bacterium]|nr:ADP-dependent NAD(P)H-hydrate dehydratase / NAD(P)H-hydrate epimerase [Clostridiales bacterium]MDN5282494.1 ADP-dependent NAD(P)H-hydrate dehydratase / NAD(P)H-hydrate epimerase [Candidatus Ozemobacter sp.]
MRLYTSDEMRAADRHAIEKIGIPSLVLMENAGVKSLFTLERILAGLVGKRFTVVCGKGNNGGDGLVIARHLLNSNVPVYVFLTAEPEKLGSDAKSNYDILCKSGIKPSVINNEQDVDRFRIAMEFSDCVIDCLFGTGFSGQIDGLAARVVEAMNDSKACKVAIDMPSGLCANSGAISPVSFVADYTITLGAPKLGLFLFPGKKIAGEVWVADIGIPAVSFAEIQSENYIVTSQLAQTLIPERDQELHKGSAGKLLILAGSDQYQGAGIMASYGALRSGVGIVNLGLPESLKGNLGCQVLPECILDFFAAKDGSFALEADMVENFNGRYRAILAGPGWGREESAKMTLDNLLDSWNGQLILDADALNLISDPTILKKCPHIPIITPHLGEMARLTGKTLEEISANQVEIARQFAIDNRLILVLKSAVTIIADHTGRIFVSSRPNSGLARGGAGDLLGGLIAGLAATGLSPLNSAVAGVHLLADSAEFAVSELGADSVTISEIASYIPRAFRKLRGDLPDAPQ